MPPKIELSKSLAVLGLIVTSFEETQMVELHRVNLSAVMAKEVINYDRTGCVLLCCMGSRPLPSFKTQHNSCFFHSFPWSVFFLLWIHFSLKHKLGKNYAQLWASSSLVVLTSLQKSVYYLRFRIVIFYFPIKLGAPWGKGLLFTPLPRGICWLCLSHSWLCCPLSWETGRGSWPFSHDLSFFSCWLSSANWTFWK